MLRGGLQRRNGVSSVYCTFFKKEPRRLSTEMGQIYCLQTRYIQLYLYRFYLAVFYISFIS